MASTSKPLRELQIYCELLVQEDPGIATVFGSFEPGHQELYSIAMPQLPDSDKSPDMVALEDKRDSVPNAMDLEFPPLLSTTTKEASSESKLASPRLILRHIPVEAISSCIKMPPSQEALLKDGKDHSSLLTRNESAYDSLQHKDSHGCPYASLVLHGD